jgi:phage anti-repressor protein
MNTIIPTKINFEELVKTNSELSVDCQSKLISTINQEFTETEKEWYVYNLFMYLNYHPTKDYPVNLEDLYKTIGFANKGNAMKTIKNNFTEGEDYKTSFLPKEKSSWGGSGREQIMLNTETFKFLCLLAKTEKGKEIRKYYVKLETIYNMLVKEQFEIAQKLIKRHSYIEIDNIKCFLSYTSDVPSDVQL